ncbi:Hypothetical predicted protein [Cloeon dipterum]|uniref:Uncharacterized protein n=2 Tax=Cloeon dipterum TaxID=197152 RepID=A0A8S1E5I2_9INSE|nr:Hypothetical predicted protein [Cloeon dipterum]
MVPEASQKQGYLENFARRRATPLAWCRRRRRVIHPERVRLPAGGVAAAGRCADCSGSRRPCDASDKVREASLASRASAPVRRRCPGCRAVRHRSGSRRPCDASDKVREASRRPCDASDKVREASLASRRVCQCAGGASAAGRCATRWAPRRPIRRRGHGAGGVARHQAATRDASDKVPQASHPQATTCDASDKVPQASHPQAATCDASDKVPQASHLQAATCDASDKVPQASHPQAATRDASDKVPQASHPQAATCDASDKVPQASHPQAATCDASDKVPKASLTDL